MSVIGGCTHTEIEHAMSAVSQETMTAAAQAAVQAVGNGEVGPAEAGLMTSQAIWTQGLEVGLRIALEDRKQAKRLVRFLKAKYEVTDDEELVAVNDAAKLTEAMKATP